MDDRLTLTEIPTRPHSPPRWDVRYDGDRIGRIEQTRIGRAHTIFYRGIVFINGVEIDIELDTDRDERAERVLAAWADPASSVHVRYWLRLPDPE